MEKLAKYQKKLKEEGRSGVLFSEGFSLLQEYGVEPRALSRKKSPSVRDWDELLYALGRVARPHSTLSLLQITLSAGAHQVSTTKRKPSNHDDITVIARVLQEKAFERAKLSNQLRDDQGDAAIIEENQRILDRLEPLVQEIEEIRERKFRLESGRQSTQKKEQVNAPVIARKSEVYTGLQIEAMEYEALCGLKKRLQDDRRKAQRRTKRAKKETTRQAAAKLVTQRNQELRIVEQAITDLKYKA